MIDDYSKYLHLVETYAELDRTSDRRLREAIFYDYVEVEFKHEGPNYNKKQEKSMEQLRKRFWEGRENGRPKAGEKAKFYRYFGRKFDNDINHFRKIHRENPIKRHWWYK